MSAAAVTGCGYTFSIYGDALQAVWGLSNSQVETVAVAGYLGGFFGFLTGIVSDRLGPRLAITVGGLLQSTAFILTWAVGKKVLPGSSHLSKTAVIAILASLAMVIYFSFPPVARLPTIYPFPLPPFLSYST